MYSPRQRIRIAVGLSVLVHLALLAWPMHHPQLGRLAGRGGPDTMIVDLVGVPPTPPPTPPSAPQRPPSPAPAQTILAARARTSRAPFAVPPPVPQATPAPAPAPVPPAPPMDMLAMVNARRERRRAAEAARMGSGSPYALPDETDDSALAAINRNLDSLGRDDGTGGVFQILTKGTYTAMFAFNGWQADSRRHWREVIEVRAGPGGDIERAIVRRMIELIRTHYAGDFNWESRRLGRVVVLSARPEDSAGLEDFLIREFFGTPLIKPAQR